MRTAEAGCDQCVARLNLGRDRRALARLGNQRSNARLEFRLAVRNGKREHPFLDPTLPADCEQEGARTARDKASVQRRTRVWSMPLFEPRTLARPHLRTGRRG
jgi:hypothetical protein